MDEFIYELMNSFINSLMNQFINLLINERTHELVNFLGKGSVGKRFSERLPDRRKAGKRLLTSVSFIRKGSGKDSRFSDLPSSRKGC